MSFNKNEYQEKRSLRLQLQAKWAKASWTRGMKIMHAFFSPSEKEERKSINPSKFHTHNKAKRRIKRMKHAVFLKSIKVN